MSTEPEGFVFVFEWQIVFNVRIHSGYPPNATSLLQPHWMRYPISVSDQPSSHVMLVSNQNGITKRWLNTTVSRSPCRYTRLANLYPHGYQQDGQRPVNFRIIKGSQPTENPPFAITANEGILFVSHPESLSLNPNQNSYELWIGWDFQESSVRKNGTILFRIDIVNGDFSESFDGCNAKLYCAEFRTETGCNQAIGSVATDQRGCAWRRNDNNDSNSGPTRMYQTCSPDLSTCPDG